MPRLSWSIAPEDVVVRIRFAEPTFVVVGFRHLTRRRSVELAFLPVTTEVLAHAPGLEAKERDWLLWQSATGRGERVVLPCDAAALCGRLGLLGGSPLTLDVGKKLGLVPADADRGAAAEALTAVVEGLYRAAAY